METDGRARAKSERILWGKILMSASIIFPGATLDRGGIVARWSERVSIIIPTKNEAGGIQEVIRDVKPYGDEILVVDGGSRDGTGRLAEEAGARVIYDNGRGKGAAIQQGIAEATGAILVFIDADGSHDPATIPILIEPILHDKADLVVASRHRGGSDEWHGDMDNFIRAMGCGILTIVMNYRWNVRVTDVLNGFRAIRRLVALKLDLRATDFDIEQHMVARCLIKDYRVAEVASHEYCRKWGHSKLPTYRKAYLFFRRLFLDVIGW